MRHLFQHLLTVLAFVGLLVVLTLPNRLAWIAQQAYLFFPLELMIICLLLLVPGRTGGVIRSVLAILLSLGLVLRIADMVNYEIFARRFNLIFDSHLLADASRLLAGVLGGLAPFVAGLILLLVIGLIWLLAFLMLGRIQQFLRSTPRAAGLSLVLMLMAWGLLRDAGWPKAEAYAWGQLVTHAEDTLESYRDIREFAELVGDDPLADRPADTLFTKLEGKDVFVVFIESYGRSLLEREPFAESVTGTLARAEEALDAEGLLMRSAYLTAVTAGGRSWLNHATLLSGAWIDSQTRYQSLVVSDRVALNRMFNSAGWRTVAAMPAISLAWPEGAYYGYDHIYNAHNFGYEGLPFNWVTMPDQYVWSALQERELTGNEERQPLMAEMALISSHAPWTPIAELVPWDQVGDGTIFNEQAQAGPTPEEVWYDMEKIRDYYRQSINYALDTLVSYLQEYGDENMVLVVLGDHEAAPRITGDWQSRDVPIHLITFDQEVIDTIDEWQWQPGMLPDAEAPVWRMDEFRNRFVDTFSDPFPVSD
ncbi:MAG: hypothetical protein LAT62_08255 [Natronospirillum sp.]|uniref:hypothetical protein n=1 Tax=Natronospirillum sp. TaxID=2812955 RepID=UPI0025F4EAA3|nr:hypothetical protein [Natronospirillum sp.]MCH8551914.1 hypothetical protein [Natronospirillum sp.]